MYIMSCIFTRCRSTSSGVFFLHRFAIVRFGVLLWRPGFKSWFQFGDWFFGSGSIVASSTEKIFPALWLVCNTGSIYISVGQSWGSKMQPYLHCVPGLGNVKIRSKKIELTDDQVHMSSKNCPILTRFQRPVCHHGSRGADSRASGETEERRGATESGEGGGGSRLHRRQGEDAQPGMERRVQAVSQDSTVRVKSDEWVWWGKAVNSKHGGPLR